MSKGQFIGVVSPTSVSQSISIDENNIAGYFNVINSDSYYFEMSGGVLSSKCTHRQTASTTLIALRDMPTSFSYKVSSELSCDIFTLTVAGTQVAEISGEKSGSWSGTLKAGDKIELKYSKDSSISRGDDNATVSNLKVTAIPVTAGTKTALTAENKGTYFKESGTSPYWSGLEFNISRDEVPGSDNTAMINLQAKQDMAVFFYCSCMMDAYSTLQVSIASKVIIDASDDNADDNTSGYFARDMKAGQSMVISWTGPSSRTYSSIHINDIQVMPMTQKATGPSGQVARRVKKELIGISAVARKVIVGKIGVSGVAREYMGGAGKLVWPPSVYNTDTASTISNNYSENNGKRVLECTGGFSKQGVAAGIIMQYARAGQRVLLAAGTVIQCDVSVTNTGFADGGLMIAYADGTTDTSYYNKTMAGEVITLSKPGYIQIEATRHSEVKTYQDGTSKSLYCITTLSALYINGENVFPG